MSRLQTVLLVALVLVSALLFWSTAGSYLPDLVSGVASLRIPRPPGWVFWAAFGIAMTMICPCRQAYKRRCRTSRATCAAPSAE
jgi:hypothetical protein